MPIITVFIVLIVVGVLLWWVNTYVPMQPTIKNILNAVVVLIVILWLISALLGVSLSSVRMPVLR